MDRFRRIRQLRVALTVWAMVLGLADNSLAEPANTNAEVDPVLRKYCVGCHGKVAQGGVNLQLMTKGETGEHFKNWQKVVDALENHHMPPAKMPQPSAQEREQSLLLVKQRLQSHAELTAGDPGKTTLRRLTSAEYAYSIKDLTGVDVRVDRDFVPDSVGGEGFTNYGDVQFMQDASLDRYLQTAKTIADHAVIGSGPLRFGSYPGRDGFESASIERIQQIYRQYGFRSSSGEGGKPFGIERYTNAIYACWRFQHRAALKQPTLTLKQSALALGENPKFVEHMWTVLTQKLPTYPTSQVVEAWRKMPAPIVNGHASSEADAKASAQVVQRVIINWPRWLFGAGAYAEGGLGDERALNLDENTVQVKKSAKLRFGLGGRTPQPVLRGYLSVINVSPDSKEPAIIHWKNATISLTDKDQKRLEPQPLMKFLSEESKKRLNVQPNGDFTTTGEVNELLEIASNGGRTALFRVDVEIERNDAIVRCSISDSEKISEGRRTSTLLGHADQPQYQVWRKNVLDFAANTPPGSHGEPTPSDKDPIPLPFDNTIDMPERARFHVRIKYYRIDKFLAEKLIDDETRKQLDQAWDDLLSSFDYHDEYFQFVAEKYSLPAKDKKVAQLETTWIEALAAEPKKYVRALHADYFRIRNLMEAAQPRHFSDTIKFAAEAWRRPLSAGEQAGLRSFYQKMRDESKLDHAAALRLTLARVLVSPSFLYRWEDGRGPVVAAASKASRTSLQRLTADELATRLSYFIWSSVPDAELRRAAAAGELQQTAKLEQQVKRMLAHPKARRFATEFFGQWLGFYRFDQFSGIDTSRFPEFSEEVKQAMYEEAVSFCEHIVRQDRPISELLFADYTFLSPALAKHYGVTKPIQGVEKVDGAGEFHRGGLLRLGSVLTVTSAPLRTSPVKRGDWLLRRIMGTPTPPPPADAGSLPADEKSFGDLTLKEKLAAHQRNATCAGCHSRIDPMGFPLERYDAVGRWRSTYSDGKPIQDASMTRDKKEIQGVEGLLGYLKANEKQVMRTMYQKLIGYALGRTAQGADELLIEELTKGGQSVPFSQAVAKVVTSPQFRHRRHELVPTNPNSDASAKTKTTAHLTKDRVTKRPVVTPETQKEIPAGGFR
jgi:hypothetical protein